MSRKTVRVDVPIGNIDDTVTLAEAAVARHTTLGANSPLTGIVAMADLSTLVTETKNFRTPAQQSKANKEAWFAQAASVIGIAEGQNLSVQKTIYWYITQSRDFLKTMNQGQEENLELWTFEVVVTQTGGRRNSAVEIPYNQPDALLTLATGIINKHNTDGAGSPLKPNLIDMADFAAKVTQAQGLREDAGEEDAQKQANNQEARKLCGYGEGQNSNTPDTIYFFLTKIRDLLLTFYDGTEQQLETFGYNVVVGTAKMPTPGAGEGPPEE